jgi:hypothetical protein
MSYTQSTFVSDPQLRNPVSQMASRVSGCGYCRARTAHTAGRVGISAAKEALP